MSGFALEYICQAGEDSYFMDPESLDPLPFPRPLLRGSERLFVREGEPVRIEVAAGKSLERVRDGKR